jgi:putative SOS response-associated peptidase YedK
LQAYGSSLASAVRTSYLRQFIVGEANSLVSPIHDRMPVMLMSDGYDRWLGPPTDMHELKEMLKPYDPSLMEAYAVSRIVNSVKNDTEECIEPLR